MTEWIVGGIVFVAAAFFAWRVWSGDFDGVPYPAMNGTDLTRRFREQIFKDGGKSQ